MTHLKHKQINTHAAINKHNLIIALLLTMLLPTLAAGTIDVTEFKTPGYEKDATPMVFSAINYCRKNKVSKLIFPTGSYNFRKELAEEKYFFFCNNDEGLKRIVFDLSDMHNFEIDAKGSEFIFNGFLCPFLIDNSTNISLRNFSIDFVRTFHSEATIVAVNKNSIDLEFSREYPYQLDNNILIFKDSEGEKYPWSNLLEYDINRRETAQYATDYYHCSNVPVVQLEARKIRLQAEIKGTVGNKLTFAPAHRQIPALVISDSKDISLYGINIYHAGGTGVIAQRSGNLTFDKLRVTPAPGKDRIISCTADATHFSGCYGKIELLNCLFENQNDDATNIHGVYVRLEKIISANEILVRLVHPQQAGDGFIKKNDRIEIVEQTALKTKCNSTVLSTIQINKERMILKLNSSIGTLVQVGDAVCRADKYPTVLIKGCTIRNNRARGILLGSREKIVVDSNYFHTPGAAILFEGDATYWYEQAGVRNVEIKNNSFDNCNFGVWGNACIQVGTGISVKMEPNNYNRNIIVENNVFRLFDPRIVNLYATDGFIFRNNMIEKTTDYVSKYSSEKEFITEGCSNIKIQN